MSNQPTDNHYFLFIIFLVLIIGLGAGILGGILSRNFSSDLPSFSANNLNLANLNTGQGLVIRNPQKVIVSQELKIKETIDSLRPSLVGIFKKIDSSSNNEDQTLSQKNISPDSQYNYYELNKPLFMGFILTSDGWVLTSIPDNLKTNFKFKNYVVINSDQQLYRIDKIANFKKLPGDLLFIHLAGASDLPIKKIVNRSDLNLGQSLLIVKGFNKVYPSILNFVSTTHQVLNSDNLDFNFGLSTGNDLDLKNSFIFTLTGNLVAVVTDKQEIVPAFYYKPFWVSLSQKTALARPSLGVNYLDLSLIKTDALNLKQGAWLFPSATQPAVLKNSPAALAGLQRGDVITWVNNQKVDTHNNLSDLLASYKAGDTITLTYNRLGIEKSANIKLRKLKE